MQTKEGQLKAVKTMRNRYGEGYWAEIGAIGGRVKGVKKGFAASPERARLAGIKGGSKSRRGRAPLTDDLVDKIVERHLLGKSVYEITKESKCSYYTVQKVVENYDA